jgi:hypothetical protein
MISERSKTGGHGVSKGLIGGLVPGRARSAGSGLATLDRRIEGHTLDRRIEVATLDRRIGVATLDRRIGVATLDRRIGA